MKISDIDKEQIINMYDNDGVTIYDLTKIFNYPYGKIAVFLSKTKLKEKAAKDQSDFENKICNMYINEKVTCTDIGKIYGMTRDQIHVMIRKHHILAKDKSLSTYDLDVQYFDNIDTPNKAYILGLLMADGCIVDRKRHYEIILSLQISDIDLLKQIQLETNNPREVKIRDNIKGFANAQPQCTITFQNKYMHDSLLQKGLLPRKSLKLEYPTCIPDELQRDFIRGFFDGNGSLSLTKDNLVTVQILSTEMFLSKLIQVVYDQTKIKIHMFDNGKKCNPIVKRISIHGAYKPVQFLNWLYDSNGLRMERKYQKYLSILDFYGYSNESILN